MAISLEERVSFVRQTSHRIIEIKGSLTDKLAKNEMDRFALFQSTDGDIVCEIDCGGGSFDRGIEIHEAFEHSKYPVIGIVSGRAYSAGFMVLQGCLIRSAGESDAFRIHAPEAIPVNTPIRYDSVEEEYLEKQRQEFRFYQPLLKEGLKRVMDLLMRRNPAIPTEKLLSLLQSNKVFLAPEALSLGFLDVIHPSA
jgi:ATP-dependent protease ClpP protease subunit